MNNRTKLIGTIALGAALLAPVAQAQIPDDRADVRGPGGIVALQQQASQHPDNRSSLRGPGSVDAVQPAIAVRPDDRSGLRGPGAFVSDTGAARHPDNREGTRGLGAVTGVEVPQVSTGFDWGDALIGGLGGVGTALLLTGCLFLLLTLRSKARMA